jgi:hypothetical protein
MRIYDIILKMMCLPHSEDLVDIEIMQSLCSTTFIIISASFSK